MASNVKIKITQDSAIQGGLRQSHPTVYAYAYIAHQMIRRPLKSLGRPEETEKEYPKEICPYEQLKEAAPV